MTASCLQPLGTARTADQLLQNTGEHQIIASSSRSLDTADQGVPASCLLIQSRLLRAMVSMLQSQTTMLAMLQAESIAITSAFLLFFLVCAVALLQSRPIKTAGHSTQHGASAIQPNSSRFLSRTRTSAAELYYLRHMRSCAATAFGNKGGGTSHSIPLQMSGADFIARLLQSVGQQVCLTIRRPLWPEAC